MNKLSELISVIVPVYMTEMYLDDCLQSIVDQTYRNLEIILIDDGSTDQCPQICDKWAEKDPRIIVIHKENGGVSSARNAGIERAQGRYIVFIDSDDLLSPLYIEYLYRALCDTEADISECRYSRRLDLLEKPSPRTTMPQPVLQTAEEALRAWSFPESDELNLVVWNKMYRSELVRDVCFSEEFNGPEDVLFTCFVFGKSRKTAHIDSILYYWRNTPGSLSNRFPENALRSIEVRFTALEYLDQYYPSIATECKILMCRLTNGLLSQLQYDTASECNKQEAKEEALSFRRRIHFTAKEWWHCTLKEKIITICSHPVFIGFYIRLRYFLSSFR